MAEVAGCGGGMKPLVKIVAYVSKCSYANARNDLVIKKKYSNVLEYYSK